MATHTMRPITAAPRLSAEEATVFVVQYFDRENRRRPGTRFFSGQQVKRHLLSFNRFADWSGIEARVVLEKDLSREIVTGGAA